MVKNRNIRRSRRRRSRRMRATRRSRNVGGRTPTYSRNRSLRIQIANISNALKPCTGTNTYSNYSDCINHCNQSYCSKKIYSTKGEDFYATHRFYPHKPRHPSKDSYKNQISTTVPRNWTPLPLD